MHRRRSQERNLEDERPSLEEVVSGRESALWWLSGVLSEGGSPTHSHSGVCSRPLEVLPNPGRLPLAYVPSGPGQPVTQPRGHWPANEASVLNPTWDPSNT